MSRRLVYLLAVLLGLAWSRPVAAQTLEAPVGGAAVPLGPGLVACTVAGGWTLEALGARVRPPSGDDAIGTRVVVRVAQTLGGCPQSTAERVLLVTGRMPAIDPASVVLYVDEGRVEARGRGLKGAQLRWLAPGHAGTDVCPDPKAEGGAQACSWAVGRELSADPGADTLRLLPAFAEVGQGQMLFDGSGQALPADGAPLPAARIVIGSLLGSESTLDLSLGRAELGLSHAEAVAAVDCGTLDCELSGKKLVVKSTALTPSAELHVRLSPRVVLERKGVLDGAPSFKLPVVRCSMALASGLPVRDSDAAKIVVRLERRCLPSRELYRFSVGQQPLRVLADAEAPDGVYVVLELGSYTQDQLPLLARRGDNGAVIATLVTPTRSLPPPRASLRVADSARIDFIPTNRPAIVNVSRPSEGEHWAVVSLPNVYTASSAGEHMSVIGDPDAEGFTQLRFALRSDQLPASLRNVDLATLSDPIQRRIGEANLPVPLGPSLGGAAQLIEFKCGPSGRSRSLQPGEPTNLPFSWRDSCRVTVHRERLRAQNGHQRIALSVDVYSSDGAPRADGHVKDTLDVEPAPEPRQIWITGVTTPFDRVVVRVSHDTSEHHYVPGSELNASGPAVQWSVILGTGHARVYATSAIPAGLYRFGDRDHSGVLSLNFGVISRLTWLTREGKEGILGLEGGVMVIGLAGSTSTTGRSLTEVGVPIGLGLSIPIANRLALAEASINLHGWVEFPISRGDPTPAFVFGPSISIGNIGANL